MSQQILQQLFVNVIHRAGNKPQITIHEDRSEALAAAQHFAQRSAAGIEVGIESPGPSPETPAESPAENFDPPIDAWKPDPPDEYSMRYGDERWICEKAFQTDGLCYYQCRRVKDESPES